VRSLDLLRSGNSGENFLYDARGIDAGEFVVESLKAVAEFFVINAEEMQGRCMQISDVDGILGNVVTEVVGCPESGAGFDSAPGHPDREAAGMMVPAGLGTVPLSLSGNASSEFTAPDNEGFVEQAA